MARVTLEFYDLDADALPDVCVKCSAPATTRKEKTFSWHPQWVIVLILVGLLPYILVALILTKRRRVSLPFCEAHKNHWTWRILVALCGLLVPVLLLAGGIALATSDGDANVYGPVFLVAPLSLVVWLIVVAVVFSTAIAVTEITDRSITLKGVGSDFAQAYEESIRGYSPRVGRRDRDDWERRDDDRLVGRRRPLDYDDPRPGTRPAPPDLPPDDKYRRG